MSITVVEEIARREGVDPVDLTPPLHDVVDTDALDALFHTSGLEDANGNPTLEFSYHGYRICVDGPEAIDVTPDDRRSGAFGSGDS
ncbi:HalOD1 output domain-containing protein [Natronobacterium texcoconense]|uniref:HalOD1 output domain-containing protein n=1 Tax=Natronobacterium texcoconense TaxID=1095778 RepID=UPI003139966C